MRLISLVSTVTELPGYEGLSVPDFIVVEENLSRTTRLCCTASINTEAPLKHFCSSAISAEYSPNIPLVDATLTALTHYMFNLNGEELCDEFYCEIKHFFALNIAANYDTRYRTALQRYRGRIRDNIQECLRSLHPEAYVGILPTPVPGTFSYLTL